MQKEIINYQMVTFICKSNPVIVFIILLFFVSTLFFPIIPAYSITTTQAYFDENFYYANDAGIFKFTLFNNENSTIIVNQAKIMLSYNLNDGSSFVSIFGESRLPLQVFVAPQEYKSFSVPFDINDNASPGYASITIMYVINGTYWNNVSFLFSTNPIYIESDWKTQYDDLDESYVQLSSNYTALDTDYTVLDTAYDNLNNTYTILYSDNELLNEQFFALQSEFEEINDELINLEDEYSVLKVDYDNLLTDYDNIKTDNLILASQYDQLVDQYQMIFDEYNKLSLTHNQLSTQYSELIDEYQMVLTEYNKLSLNYQILNSEYITLLKNYENVQFQYDDVKTTELLIKQEFEKSQIPVSKSNSAIFFDEFRKLIVTDQPSLQQPNDYSLQNQLNRLVSLKSERDNFEFYLYITIIVAIILIVMTYNITNYKLKKNKSRSTSTSDFMGHLDQESIDSVKQIKKALNLWENKENNFLVKGYDNKNLQSIYVIKKIQEILKDWKDKE